MLTRQTKISQAIAGAIALAAALVFGTLGACSSSQSGKGNNGGSAGSGGNGGTGGNAGTGGSPGTGGTGGSGGGSGGTGGAAGSGGSAGSGGQSPCDTCFDTSCAAELAACNASTACKALANCYASCATLSCQVQCDKTNAGGVALISAAFQCEASQCSDVCTCKPSTASGKCSTFPLCGCALSENCVFDSNNETACRAPGPTLPHGDCTTTECGQNFACVGNTCRPYCQVDTDCPAQARRECIQVVDLDNNNTPIPGFKVCRQHCNLVDVTNTAHDPAFGACGPGTTCGLYGDSTDWYTSCVPSKPTSPCSDDGDCAAGFGCSTAGTCIKWCRVGTNSDCPSGQSCRSLTTKILVEATGGRKEYGFCGTTTPPADGGPG